MDTIKPSDLEQNSFTIKVILVENDHLATVNFLKKFGEKLSVKVIESAEECLEFIKNTYPPDAIIIGRNMGGLKFLETVRAESWTRTLPVIITSDQITQGLIKEVLEKKGDDLFPKDFSEGDLVTRLEYFIKRRHYEATQQAKSNILAVKIPLWKRSIDVLSTGFALLFLSPILAIVAILIKLDSKGPVVYKSRRVGAGYKVFEIYKFRTMRTDADQLIKNMGDLNMYTKETAEKKIEGLCEDCAMKGVCQQQLFFDGEVVCEKAYLAEKKEKVAFMKFQNDPRITKFGGFLRNSSIDELPQLFNIFMGDMSLIGNRPLPLYEAEKLTTDKYIERFAGPGGLTGLWQVTKRGKGKKEMTEEERIELDIEYARNFSFKYDMKIFFMTFPALLQSENV
ncbi:lipopolysaccharide/colanic/teichoic acid biosynthesis glycosyltransferase [Arcicella aurantiaca]|uniref:Lipopolysaccharide/colanic/teichoic acid biosynthesis glycosyltransferase n=1 Tax=Arcicella aurantiaca TaxID=591202 RepID=A0A316DPU4_9BACT|nr:sugar transferase [Arcicella aurantiaca]PWK20101.1 lipopolysaccharide/colanic/teichoic acid biosynthesis glycosyltransferase [Arcicella aurantiaca]